MNTSHEVPREKSEKQEFKFLTGNATKSTNPLLTSRVYPQEDDDFRTQFDRDYTRIIHSRAFRRLRHKTQVFISPKNDHLCTRLEHSLHVASIARTISKALKLNNELVAAIAVGHDLGHAPFGHEGEKHLDTQARRYGLEFSHELHSLRVIDRLESPYPDHSGLNLTFAVRDGIACHHGEGFEQKLAPDRTKAPGDLLKMKCAALPATLEGCVVRFADKVAYLGRDLEDALEVSLIQEDQIPDIIRKTLGADNRSIIDALIRDIYRNSSSRCGFIAVSPEVHKALNIFNDFNKDCIYEHYKVKGRFTQVSKAIEAMFDEFYPLIEKAQGCDEPNKAGTNTLFPTRDENCIRVVLSEFLLKDVKGWREEHPCQLTIDFIAGMTDSYFVSAFNELFLPSSLV